MAVELMVLARVGAKAEDIANRMPYLGALIKKERDLEALQKRRR